MGITGLYPAPLQREATKGDLGLPSWKELTVEQADHQASSLDKDQESSVTSRTLGRLRTSLAPILKRGAVTEITGNKVPLSGYSRFLN